MPIWLQIVLQAKAPMAILLLCEHPGACLQNKSCGC